MFVTIEFHNRSVDEDSLSGLTRQLQWVAAKLDFDWGTIRSFHHVPDECSLEQTTFIALEIVISIVLDTRRYQASLSRAGPGGSADGALVVLSHALRAR